MSKEKECNYRNNDQENSTGFKISDAEKLFNLIFGGEEIEKSKNPYDNYDLCDCDACHIKSQCFTYLSKQKELKDEHDNSSVNNSSNITDSEKINEVASLIMKLQHDVDNIQQKINDINQKVSNKNTENDIPITAELKEFIIPEDDIVKRIYKKLKKKLVNQSYETNQYVTDMSAAVTSSIARECKEVKSSIYHNQLIMESIISELKNISENVNTLHASMDEQKENSSTTKSGKTNTDKKSVNK